MGARLSKTIHAIMPSFAGSIVVLATILSSPAAAENSAIFGYARGPLYNVGVTLQLCFADPNGNWFRAVMFVRPGFVWPDGKIQEACWRPDPDDADILDVCAVADGKFLGECSFFSKDRFVDPATLPRRAF
jgi:hypothetical protein